MSSARSATRQPEADLFGVRRAGIHPLGLNSSCRANSRSKSRCSTGTSCSCRCDISEPRADRRRSPRRRRLRLRFARHSSRHAETCCARDVGTCARVRDASVADPSPPAAQRLRLFSAPRGFPPRARARYLMRHGGPAWFLFWLAPYVRAAARSPVPRWGGSHREPCRAIVGPSSPRELASWLSDRTVIAHSRCRDRRLPGEQLVARCSRQAKRSSSSPWMTERTPHARWAAAADSRRAVSNARSRPCPRLLPGRAPAGQGPRGQTSGRVVACALDIRVRARRSGVPAVRPSSLRSDHPSRSCATARPLPLDACCAGGRHSAACLERSSRTRRISPRPGGARCSTGD